MTRVGSTTNSADPPAAGTARRMLVVVVGVIFATPLMVVAMVLVQKLYIEEFLESGSRSP